MLAEELASGDAIVFVMDDDAFAWDLQAVGAEGTCPQARRLCVWREGPMGLWDGWNAITTAQSGAQAG